MAHKLDKSLGEIISNYCRVFVGGLNQSVDESQLRKFFEKYGSIEDVKIMHDKAGISRGFGFVSFKDQIAWEKLEGKSLFLAGRKIDVKHAMSSEEMAESCKIFVGGLNWNTTDEHFFEFFSQYGEVKEATIQRTSDGESRCFGFVVFKNYESLNKCIGIPLKIDGRTIEIKAAVARKGSDPYHKTRKIFVGGLSQSVDDDGLRRYFSKFGSVSNAYVRMDNKTSRSRGFGYVAFVSEDIVEKVTAISSHKIDGKMVEVKKAIPRDLMDGTNQSFSGRGRGRGRGRGTDNRFNNDSINGMFKGYGFPMMGLNPMSMMSMGMMPMMFNPMLGMSSEGYGAVGGRFGKYGGRGRGRRGRQRPY